MLLPYAALLSDLPAMPSLSPAVSATPVELIAPGSAEKSAAMFGAGAAGAVFRERGNTFYAPLHLFNFVNSPQQLAKAVACGRSLSMWAIVSYIILMLATVYRHDGKKAADRPIAYPQI